MIVTEIAAWGANWAGQTSISPSLSNVVALAAGSDFNLALRVDGTVVGWGANDYAKTTPPQTLSNVVAISAGEEHGLALKSDARVVAWGYGSGVTNVPIALSNVIAVAAGDDHNLALKSDGTVVTWGSDSYGEASLPPGVSNIIAIATGEGLSVFLQANGTVFVRGFYWATNGFPGNLSNVVAIAAGNGHGLALKADGKVVSWGGTGTAPTNLNNVVTISAGGGIRTGGGHSLALRSDGSVVSWGANSSDQTNVPAGLNTAVAVAAGGSHSLALLGGAPRLLEPHPLVRRVRPQTAVSLQVTAYGMSPLHYQWQLNGTNVPGATNAGYSFLTSSNSAGNYRVLVSNYSGSATGETVQVVVDVIPPYVTTNSPSGDIAGTASSMDIWFSEAMNATSLNSNTVTLLRPNSQPLPLRSVSDLGANRYRLGFDPQTQIGTYRAIIGPGVQDVAGNSLDQDRDGIQGEAIQDAYTAALNLANVDLQITNITLSTNTLMPGQLVTISWIGRNGSGAPLVGNWSDAIYLSSDNRWDIHDTRLAVVAHNGGLAQNASYSTNTTIVVPGALPGSAYVLLRADVFNQEREGSETNNVAFYGPVPVGVPGLAANGGLATGTLTLQNRMRLYAVSLASGQSIRIRLTGQAAFGANQLYASLDVLPTRATNDFRSTIAGSQNQEIALTAPSEGGIYYVMIYGDQIGAGNPYELRIETAPIFLTGIVPGRLGSGVSATVTLTGAGFDDTTFVTFTDTNGFVHDAINAERISSQTMLLHLGLTNWLPGPYSVIANKAGTNATLLSALTVEPGITRLDTALSVPNALRFSDGKGTLWIEYTNSGNLPMPAPLLVLRSTPATYLTTDPLAPPMRRSQAPTNVTNVVQVLAVGASATPWLLQPGESGRIPIYNLGLALPWPSSAQPVTFTLTVMTANNSNVIDWAAQAPLIRPPGMDTVEWSQVFAALQERIGTTWGTYVAALETAFQFTVPAAPGGTDAGNLFRILFQQARGIGSSTLTGQVVNATNSQPVQSVEVVVRQEFGTNFSLVRSATADALGTFAFTNLPAGQYTLQVQGYYSTNTFSYAVLDRAAVTGAVLRVLPIPIETSPPPALVQNSDPVFVNETNGTAHLVWKRDAEVWHAYHDGTNWITDGAVPGASGFEPQAVWSSRLIDGLSPGLFITWRIETSSNSSLHYLVGRRRVGTNGYEWSATRLFNPSNQVDNSHPALTITPAGHVIGAWQTYNSRISDDTDLYYRELTISHDELSWINQSPLAFASPFFLKAAEPAELSISFEKKFAEFELPKSIPLFGGVYGGSLSGEFRGALGCAPLLGADVETEMKFPSKITFTGQATGKAKWRTEKRCPECLYVFDQSSLDFSIAYGQDISAFAWNGLGVGLVLGAHVDLSLASKLAWEGANFPSWPSSGSGSITIGAGPYGKAFIRIPGTALKAEGEVSGIGSFTVSYDSFQNLRRDLEGSLTLSAKCRVGPVSVTWSKKWTTGEEKNFALRAANLADGVPSIGMNPLLGTSAIYSGTPVLSNVVSSLRNDGVASVTTTPVGDSLLVWTRDSETPDTWLGSAVFATSWDGGGWGQPTELPQSKGFNSEVKVVSNATGRPMAVWSMASNFSLTTNSNVEAVLGAMSSNNIVFSLNSNGVWTPPIALAEIAGSDHSVSVGRSTDHRVVAAWINESGNTQKLYAAWWDGTDWSTPQVVASGQFAGQITVGIVGTKTTLMWTQDLGNENNGNQFALFSSEFASGAWFPPAVWTAGDGQLAQSPKANGPGRLAFANAAAFSLPSPPASCCSCSTDPTPPNPTNSTPPSPPNPSSGKPTPGSDPNFPTVTSTTPAVRSYDPNEKLGPLGYGGTGFLQVDETLVYQIQFENLASAGAPAQQVLITDTLDPDLDLSTFEIFEISFSTNLLSFPPGLDASDDLLSLDVGGTTLFAEVRSSINYSTRMFTVTLTALDPLTGWLPEDPLVGLLYPNDATGRGEGYITYLVSARSDATTGTVITNQARIVFDYNDPINTPIVLNTMDAAPPTSSVMALPAQSGRTFQLRWGGSDDPGGSGLAGYDVFVSTNGVDYMRWLIATLHTNALFVGELGAHYWFFSVARDFVGHQEATPIIADTQTTVPGNAPVLQTVSSMTVDAGTSLTFTNSVQGGTPGATFLFSLSDSAPGGTSVNATNGVFRWTPNCSQASRLHSITIWVADSGNTNLMDAMTFTVAVGECVVPSLGRLVLLAGTGGKIPVNLVSSVPLTNLSMTVEAPLDRVTSFFIEPIVPQICSHQLITLSNSFSLLSVTTCSNQFLIGTQQVAWLHFTAISNQSSAFVPLQLDNTVGHQVGGAEVRNFAPQSGRLVVVGEEPLMEATFGTNHQPVLTLYGKPGFTYDVRSATSLNSGAVWQSHWQGPQNDLFQQFPASITNHALFFRAVRQP